MPNVHRKCVRRFAYGELAQARQRLSSRVRRRTLVAKSAAALAVVGMACTLNGSGVAAAGLDNELRLIDTQHRELQVQQWDTSLIGVIPLDRNRLTREWFHSGKATYTCAGAGCDEFAGTLQLGYQIAFPWSLGVALRFTYTTPNVRLDKVNSRVVNGNGGGGGIITPNLLPGVSITANLGNGPGVQEVATFSVAVAGPSRSVAVSNAHGTVTGAVGGVLLRPFARLTSKTGDSVTTYGDPWDMN
ncbi:porin [Mycobacterium sp. CBMA 213]|nr:porin [Mycolicibacterium sp. CBMA 213]